MKKNEKRPNTGSEKELDSEGTRGPEEERGPAEPAEAQAPEATPETKTPAEQVAEPAADRGQEEPAEVKAAETEADAEAPTEGRPGRPRRYLPTAAISVGVLVLGVALFVAGFWTHSLLDDDLDLTPFEDKLVALEERVSGFDERTGEIQDILSGVVANADGDDEPTANPAAATSSASNDDPSWGPDDASVVIVEFTDFQCPFCARHSQQTLPSIKEAYGEKVRYILRDFPITGIHQFAQKAAEAGQCAHEQGLFWEYHDLLFANQEALTVDDLKRYAEQVGADTGEFNDCLDSGKNQREVLQDLQDGQSAGVSGTPGFLVNGVLVSGAQPFEAFQQVIDQLLAAEE
jgi:protein-disulfide isomerase